MMSSFKKEFWEALKLIGAICIVFGFTLVIIGAILGLPAAYWYLIKGCGIFANFCQPSIFDAVIIIVLFIISYAVVYALIESKIGDEK